VLFFWCDCITPASGFSSLWKSCIFRVVTLFWACNMCKAIFTQQFSQAQVAGLCLQLCLMDKNLTSLTISWRKEETQERYARYNEEKEEICLGFICQYYYRTLQIRVTQLNHCFYMQQL
jgi:hypothetical protein